MNRSFYIFGALWILLIVGCGKKGDPVAPPVLPAQATMITGTVVDSSGAPIESVAIKIKYYFAPVTSKGNKSEPCSLIYFTAVRVTDAVRLDWRTVWETDAERWDVERSVIGDSSYQKIATVQGNLTTNNPVDYSYNDTTAGAAQADFYRLCLIDIIGSRYYYGPVGLGPVPTYHDSFTSAYPCPFSINTQFGFSLACSSQVKVTIKQKDLAVKTLVDQIMQAGLHSLMWNGYDSGNIPMAAGYYISECVISRNDSTIKFAEPLFINIEDISSIRVNAYTSAQGAFTIADIPIDSTFAGKDDTGSALGTYKVCDSVTVYAIKSGCPERSTTLTLGRNTTSTIKFVLK